MQGWAVAGKGQQQKVLEPSQINSANKHHSYHSGQAPGAGEKFRYLLNLFNSLISRAYFQGFLIYPISLISGGLFPKLIKFTQFAYFRRLFPGLMAKRQVRGVKESPK